jgi:hypothetical protein
LIDSDAVAGGEVDTVDVCAAALIVEKNFLHHATEAAAAVRQFPSEVGQRLTIVLVVSKDDCGGLNFRFGAHDNVRCSNQEMVSRDDLIDWEIGGKGRIVSCDQDRLWLYISKSYRAIRRRFFLI